MKDGFEFGSAVRLPAAFRFENGCIDRWARGDLDTSQGRGIEPFGPMLGSQIDFGFARIAIRSLSRFCLVILRALMSRCNHVTRSKQAMSIKSIARLASDPLQHVVIEHWRPLDYGLKAALPSVSVLDLDFENGTHHLAPASDVSKVKKAPSGA